MSNTDPILTCPDCDSERVTVAHVQMFMANTLEHYCHSLKTHDANTYAHCIDCGWKGLREDLKEQP